MLKNSKKSIYPEQNISYDCLLYVNTLTNKEIIIMKKLKLFFLTVLTFVMASSFGQQGQGQRQQRTPEERAKAQVEWMTKDLSLDQAMQTKVSDVLVKYMKKSTEERQKLTAANTDRETMRTKLAAITAAQDNELKSVLGDAKYALYQKKAAERRAAAQQRNQ
jgi:periplasmic protein CpxP/Spy